MITNKCINCSEIKLPGAFAVSCGVLNPYAVRVKIFSYEWDYLGSLLAKKLLNSGLPDKKFQLFFLEDEGAYSFFKNLRKEGVDIKATKIGFKKTIEARDEWAIIYLPVLKKGLLVKILKSVKKVHKRNLILASVFYEACQKQKW